MPRDPSLRASTERLHNRSAGHAISGHIVDNQSRPVPGIKVTATGPVTAATTTDSDGSYVIAGLTAGSYAIIASSRWFQDRRTIESPWC